MKKVRDSYAAILTEEHKADSEYSNERFSVSRGKSLII